MSEGGAEHDGHAGYADWWQQRWERGLVLGSKGIDHVDGGVAACVGAGEETGSDVDRDEVHKQSIVGTIWDDNRLLRSSRHPYSSVRSGNGSGGDGGGDGGGEGDNGGDGGGSGGGGGDGSCRPVRWTKSGRYVVNPSGASYTGSYTGST